MKASCFPKLDILAIEALPRGGYLIRPVSLEGGQEVVGKPIAAAQCWDGLIDSIGRILK